MKANSSNRNGVVKIEAAGELLHEVDLSSVSLQWNFTRRTHQEVGDESHHLSKTEDFCNHVEVKQHGRVACPFGKGSATISMSTSLSQAPDFKVSLQASLRLIRLS